MSWLAGARARLTLLFAKRASESRMSDEIRFHIEMETERLVREEKVALDEARRRALATFGGVTRHTETLREGRGLAWLGGLSLDFRLAARMLLKYPGLTFVSVIGMAVAVAIGAVTFSAIYTMVDDALPAPVSEGARVIAIRNVDSRRGGEGRATHLFDLTVWRDALTTVQQLGAYRIIARNLIADDNRAESTRIAEMTASGFRIARVPPAMGRYLNDADERPGAPNVVVIGYELWQSRFVGRPDIVGRRVSIGDEAYTIVGVMPADFAFPVNNRVWTPLRLNAAEYEVGNAPSVEVFGRMARGATLGEVRRQIATIGQRLAATYPESHGHLRTRVVPYTRMFIDNPETTWLFDLVQLLVTMLLIVIGTNVAILVYARTAGRIGEIAVRTALGASRARIVAQLFAEALVLSSVAAAAGLGVAYLALENIDTALGRIQAEQLPYWMRFHVSTGVVLYAVGLAILAAVIVGVLPALKATRRDVRTSLQQIGAGGSGGGMRLGRTWTLLIVAQVAIAVAVLPVALAGVAAWKRAEGAQTRLAARQILTATLYLDRPDLAGQRPVGKRSVLGKLATLGASRDIARADSDAAPRFVALRQDLAARLRAEPGVADVVFASNPPGNEQSSRVEVNAVGSRPGDTSATSAVVAITRIDASYLSAFGIPLLAGRPFQSADIGARTSTAIVNQSFARKLFGETNPLGRRLRSAASSASATPAPWEEIVGVVPDFPIDSGSPSPKVYRPLLQASAEPLMIAVRVNGGGASPATFANRLRELAVATNPMLRLESIKPLDQTLYDSNADMRLTVFALELVTMSAVLLSAAGIYALMSFTITRRRREIGIRSALGAGPRRVLGGVLSRVFVHVAIGIAVGVVVAGVLDRLLEGGWTGRRATFVLPAVAAFMLVTSLIAALRPASWALRIPPTEALRAD